MARRLPRAGGYSRTMPAPQRHRRLLVIACLALVAGCATEPASETGAGSITRPALPIDARPTHGTVVHVATDGRDDAPGTEDRPVRTLARARDIVRDRVRVGLDSSVEVRIGAGTYGLEEPLVLDTPADSGTTEHAITWTARPGDRVLVSGGREIDGWTLATTSGTGRLWTTSLDAGWSFRDLYLDNRRLVRARFPNEEQLPIVADATDADGSRRFRVAKTIPGADAFDPAEGVEAVVDHRWMEPRQRVSAVRPDARGQWLVFDADRPLGPFPDPGTPYASISADPDEGCGLYLEGSRAFLDAPGEWHLAPDGTLSVFLPAGVDPNASNVVAPVARNLVVIDGLTNVHLRDLSFAHAGVDLGPAGYDPYQAGRQRGLAARGRRDVLPAAIELRRAAGCSVWRCRVAHTGGLGLVAGGRGVGIVANTVFDVGATGIFVGNVGTPGAIAPEDVLVSDNAVVSYGRTFRDSVGIWLGPSARCTIAHNLVRDGHYTGISVGWKWNDVEPNLSETVVAGNLVEEVMETLVDGAAIYCLGRSDDGQLTSNVTQQLRRNPRNESPGAVNGFQWDAGSSGWHVALNVTRELADRIPTSRGTRLAMDRSTGRPYQLSDHRQYPVCPSDLTWGVNYIDQPCPRCTACGERVPGLVRLRTAGMQPNAYRTLKEAGPREPHRAFVLARDPLVSPAR